MGREGRRELKGWGKEKISGGKTVMRKQNTR
jgi:hypothetical protein